MAKIKTKTKTKAKSKAIRINVNLHVGQRLRARRVTLGLSQGDVGRAIGIASQQVQKYEKGVNAMNAQRFCDFARFLKVPVAYFFEGIDAPASARTASWASGIGPAGLKAASDRESLEILKSFKRIKDYALRKRIADMLRSLALKDI